MSNVQWRSERVNMCDIASQDLGKFGSEFLNYLSAKEYEVEAFFMGDVLHFRDFSTYYYVEEKLDAFQAGWLAGRQVMVEDIGEFGL
jgi:hypothetical protein